MSVVRATMRAVVLFDRIKRHISMRPLLWARRERGLSPLIVLAARVGEQTR